MRAPADADAAVDLHAHGTDSDGAHPPDRVVEQAAAAGVAVFALTDHDTLAGLPAARAAAERRGVHFVAGVEISTRDGGGIERHVLAYGFDEADPRLAEGLEANRGARRMRLDRMVRALKCCGVEISAEQVLAVSGGSPVGRPHVADALVAAGRARSRQEAFDRWLGDGRAAAVPKDVLTCAEAARLVHDAGGVTSLAHPGRRWSEQLLDALVEDGLDGVEAHHPCHSEADARRLEAAAARRRLLVSGGSDNHGDEVGMRNMRALRVRAAMVGGLLERVGVPVAAGVSAG